MELFQYQWVDLFATKGIEYILVILFLISIVPVWRLVRGPVRAGMRLVGRAASVLWGWFNFPQGIYYHQGHSWALPEDGVLKVGLDDFAQKLLGRPDAVELPTVGSKVKQGDIGWKMVIGGKTIEMLSPVSGEVVAINMKVLENPALLNMDPYGEGWLLKVKPENARIDLRNLLKGETLKGWIETTLERLGRRLGGELGLVYQDGGAPISGFARTLSPDKWDEIAREFLIPET